MTETHESPLTLEVIYQHVTRDYLIKQLRRNNNTEAMNRLEDGTTTREDLICFAVIVLLNQLSTRMNFNNRFRSNDL